MMTIGILLALATFAAVYWWSDVRSASRAVWDAVRIERAESRESERGVPSLVPARELAPVAGRRGVSVAAVGDPPRSGGREVEAKESAMEQAQEIITLIRGYLDEMQYHYQVRADGAALRMPIHGKCADYTVGIYGDRHVVGVVVHVPLVVPADHRVRMAETITRANFGLKFGSFELDMSDGELRLRAGVPWYGDGPSRDEFAMMFHTLLWTVERYFRAFCRLIYGDDLSPAEVIAEVEMAE